MQKTSEQDGFLANEQAQMRAHLAMTYAERLRWLEQAKRFARVALGAASAASAQIKAP